jgi:hypothetical protein
MDELEGAVSRLKIDSVPGPDNIFSKLLINADKTVLDFLLQIFSFAFFHCLGKYPSFQLLLKICSRKSKTVLSALISNLENSHIN